MRPSAASKTEPTADDRVAARTPDPVAIARFATEVRSGLDRQGQKELPSKYLYDSVGSALFEVIAELPEYGLSRAGSRLLRRHAAQIVRPLSASVLVAELGSGNARNTRWILGALARGNVPITYSPIDISRTALAQAERELNRLESVSIVGYEREYLEGLREVVANRPERQDLLVLFLGGTIGNFDRPAADQFLKSVRAALRPGDRLLISTDLVKPVPVLLLAYDDPIGVTAAFDLNLLARINRELGGDFVISGFRHEARWNEPERRIEMHLRSTVGQTVHIGAADLTVTFRPGETIWTESSHKFTLDEVGAMASRAGFRCERQWVDQEWPFAQNLLVAE